MPSSHRHCSDHLSLAPPTAPPLWGLSYKALGNPMQLGSKNQALEFNIQLSGFPLFLRRALWFFACMTVLLNIINSLRERDALILLNGLIDGVFLWAMGRFAIRSFPRKVSIEGDEVIFHRVPTTFIFISGVLIPFGVTDRVSRQKSEVVLEWIGRTLTLNDMKFGKSIRLASGAHAKQLAQWFQQSGIQTPIGG